MSKRRPRLSDVKKSKSLSGLFVGRETELRTFGDALDRTVALDVDNSDTWLYPHIFLIVGLGGIGKTSLVTEFLKACGEKKETIYEVRIDSEKSPITDPDSFMHFLHDKIVDTIPQAESKLKPYRDAVEKRKQIRRQVEQEKEAERSAEFEPLVTAAAKLMSIPAGPVAPVVEEVVKATVHRGARFIAGTHDGFINWLHTRGKLSHEEFSLVKNHLALTEMFMDCLGDLTEKHPLVIAIDTYEHLDRLVGLDKWLREAVLDFSPLRVLWIIAGRADTPFLSRYREASETELFLANMPLDYLTKRDINSYLKVRSILLEDDGRRKELAEIIEGISQGIPLAIRALVDMHNQNMAITDLFGDLESQNIARGAVVKVLTERFLKWCDEERARDEIDCESLKQDKRWMQSLALLGRYDRRALDFLIDSIGIQNVSASELLEGLDRRYAFIFAHSENQMHKKVKEILRDDLRGQSLDEWQYNLVKIAYEYYQQHLAEIEEKIGVDRERVVRDEEWQETAHDLLNISFWVDSHGRVGVEVLMQLVVEAHIFSPQFRDKCLTLASEFTNIDAHQRNMIDLWLSIQQIDDDDDISEHKKLARKLKEKIKQWSLSSTAQAIIWMMWGNVLAFEDNYVEAAQMYQRADQISVNRFEQLDNMLARRLGAIAETLYSADSESILAGEIINRAVEIAPKLSSVQTSLGNIYFFVQHKKKEALLAFGRAIELDEDAIRARYGIGIIHFIEGDKSEALIVFEEITSNNPKFVPAYLMMGQIHLSQKDYDTALNILQQAVGIDPEFMPLYHEIGYIYYRLKQYDDAISTYKHVLEHDPDSPIRVYIQLGNLYLGSKDFDSAWNIFKSASQCKADNKAPAYAGMALASLKKGDVNDAKKSAQKAISVDSEYASGYAIFARVLFRKRDYEKSLEKYNRAIEIDPDEAYLFHGRSDTYRKLKKYKLALGDNNQAVELAPDDADIISGRGSMYLAIGRVKDAWDDFNQAIYLDSACVKAYIGRGIVHRVEKRFEEALSDHNYALELDIEDAIAFLQRGITQFRLGNHDEAFADYEKVMQLDSQLPEVFAAKGRDFYKLGNYEESISNFVRAKKLDLDLELEINFNEIGLELSYEGKYREAIKFHKQGLKYGDRPVSARYNIAICTVRMFGDGKKAVREIRDARKALEKLQSNAESDDDKGRALYGFAGLAAVAGDLEKVLNLLKQALDMCVDGVEWASKEPAWIELRGTPEFEKILEEALQKHEHREIIK